MVEVLIVLLGHPAVAPAGTVEKVSHGVSYRIVHGYAPVFIYGMFCLVDIFPLILVDKRSREERILAPPLVVKTCVGDIFIRVRVRAVKTVPGVCRGSEIPVEGHITVRVALVYRLVRDPDMPGPYDIA